MKISYPQYVLGILFLVYVLNFVDRYIFSILAEDIKEDLGFSDADLGFLSGTVFSVFYTIFGIPLARLADVWNRKNLISIGLTSWSIMTALSGVARSFASMAFCRFGVAIGESSASPAAMSILSDYFPKKMRATVFSLYGAGGYVGMGLGLFIGGTVLDAWNGAWPDGVGAPFGLKGWQASFMIVGFPGVLLAGLVWTLKEPLRGQADGVVTEPHPRPFQEVTSLLAGMTPLVNLWFFIRTNVSRRTIILNLASAFALALVALAFIRITGDLLQWMTVCIGGYVAISWAQALSHRDPAVFDMIFASKTLLLVSFGGGVALFMGLAMGFWTIPFLIRFHGAEASAIGALLGLGNAVMGFTGMVLGGFLADRLRQQTGKGRLYVLLLATAGGGLSILAFLTMQNIQLVYGAIFMSYLFGAMGYGPANSTVSDLVLPRARATAIAFYFLVTSFIGGALGPYFIGLISDSMIATGIDDGEALRVAMLWSLTAPAISAVLIGVALKFIERDEAAIKERARALGENV